MRLIRLDARVPQGPFVNVAQLKTRDILPRRNVIGTWTAAFSRSIFQSGAPLKKQAAFCREISGAKVSVRL